MNTFWMHFKENKNTDFDVQVVQRPNIPTPNRRVSYIKVAGRDGSLVSTDDTYDDITFEVKLNFLSNRHDSFMPQSRRVKNWLTGSGPLKFSDDNEVFYKVKDAKDRKILGNKGTVSYLIASQFIPLTNEETMALMYQYSAADREPVNDLSEILAKFNLCVLLHSADIIATYCIEKND